LKGAKLSNKFFKETSLIATTNKFKKEGRFWFVPLVPNKIFLKKVKKKYLIKKLTTNIQKEPECSLIPILYLHVL
jgi:hypothetical protein